MSVVTVPGAVGSERIPTTHRVAILTLISAWLCVSALPACGVFQTAPTQRGDWGWMLSETGEWAHVPESPYYRAYEATRQHWDAQGELPPCDNRWDRVEVIEADGPVYNGQAHAYVPSSTAKRAVIVLRTDLGPDVAERLFVHEMTHVCGFWAGVGGDHRHSDPRRWMPATSSVEARATCELQGRACSSERAYRRQLATF